MPSPGGNRRRCRALGKLFLDVTYPAQVSNQALYDVLGRYVTFTDRRIQRGDIHIAQFVRDGRHRFRIHQSLQR